jgi:hypothetical protein
MYMLLLARLWWFFIMLLFGLFVFFNPHQLSLPVYPGFVRAHLWGYHTTKTSVYLETTHVPLWSHLRQWRLYDLDHSPFTPVWHDAYLPWLTGGDGVMISEVGRWSVKCSDAMTRSSTCHHPPTIQPPQPSTPATLQAWGECTRRVGLSLYRPLNTLNNCIYSQT